MAKLSQQILPILVKLKDKGINKIEITFSGSGDSGDIDDLIYYDVTDKYYYSRDMVKNSYMTDEEYNLLQNDCYEFIDDAIEGADWYNNEGGFGNITIDLDTMTANVEYSQRTVEEYSWEDLSLFDI
mgnify:CR=1 FL=1|jgi:hypothetical protein